MPADLGGQPARTAFSTSRRCARRMSLRPAAPDTKASNRPADESERRHRRHAGERAFDRRLDGVKRLGDVCCRLLRQVKYLLLRRRNSAMSPRNLIVSAPGESAMGVPRGLPPLVHGQFFCALRADAVDLPRPRQYVVGATGRCPSPRVALTTRAQQCDNMVSIASPCGGESRGSRPACRARRLVRSVHGDRRQASSQRGGAKPTRSRRDPLRRMRFPRLPPSRVALVDLLPQGDDQFRRLSA